jgi:uncharacterized protein (PEP-CTERM system associated)
MVGAPAARRIALAASGVIGVVGLVYSVGARGGDWSITPSLSVSETFTDNANLATDEGDPNSDFITQVAPGVSVRGTGGRGNLNLDYSLSQYLYHRNTRDDATNNSLAATGQVEIWEQIAFIDGRASIAQVVDQTTAPTSDSVTGQNVNRTETQAFEISPFVRHHFGAWADTEARYNYSGVSTETDRIEDVTIRSEQVRVSSGRRFTQLLWSLTALNSKTTNEGDEPTERERRVDTDFTYILNRHVSLLTGVGYEDIEDPGLTSQPSGVTWNAGLALQPGPRTSLRFTTGERNGDTTYDFEGSHVLSPRTSIRASYSESIQTSQRQLSENLDFLAVDPLTGQFIDSRTGLPFRTDDAFGLTENTFRQKRFTLGLSGSRRRNTFGAQLFWEERETEATGIVETGYGGNINLSRRMSPRLTGGLSLSYRTTDLGTVDERTEDEIGASTRLSYQVGNDVQATLSYNLTLRKVNNAPDDLMENSVTLGLTKSF